MTDPKIVKQEARIKNQKKEFLKEISEFLDKRGIKNEHVLDFICFEHKGRHYRARNIAEVKTALGMYL